MDFPAEFWFIDRVTGTCFITEDEHLICINSVSDVYGKMTTLKVKGSLITSIDLHAREAGVCTERRPVLARLLNGKTGAETTQQLNALITLCNKRNDQEIEKVKQVLETLLLFATYRPDGVWYAW